MAGDPHDIHSRMESGDMDDYETGLGDRVRKYKRKIDPDAAYDENREDGCLELQGGAFTQGQAG